MTAAPRIVALAIALSALTACGTAPKKSAPPQAERATAAAGEGAHDHRNRSAHGPKRSPYAPAVEDPTKRGDYVAGGLYAPHIQDSVPDEIVDVDAIPEPEVKDEPRSRVGNRHYAVLGKRYQVRDSAEGYVEEGMASYYGKKFHGRLTSNQEVYDMYAFSAAHKSLPLPSYVRVTNLANGKSVVVRVNDRGPFHAGRVIDLSFAAATKLGFTKQGTAKVEVRALTPADGRGGRPDERTARTARAEPPAKPTPATVADNSVSADEFERWMQAQGIRFAGKPDAGKPDQAIGALPVTAVLPVASPSSIQVASAGTSDKTGDVLLQLASFTARDNAERARDTLQAGGIDALRIDEASVNGQPVWRLRIGPVPASRVQELSARAADLGFVSAQIVRE
jgi:rare lipoprotein A